MSQDSIEFQPMPGDANEDDRVRHFFRVPASENDHVLAIFYGKSYTVSDISATGIAIYTDDCLIFESGQIIDDAEFVLGNHRFLHLTAKVIHCSVHESGELRYGITWLNMGPGDKKILDQVLGEMKERALKKQ